MSDDLPMRKPLLGLILDREGGLARAELERALSCWHMHRLRGKMTAFGQVVLELGLMSAQELGRYVAMQKFFAVVPGGRKPLGRLILENGLLKPSLLLEALERQANGGGRLGEILVEMGLLKRPQVEILLRFQGRCA
ncbi:MAG: hypothetical protein ACLGIN_08045 [Candidatus Sericytochromatia bacterium]